MPDILIRGMRKPTSCDDCPMYTCMHNFDDCPLVELPAHGDLIERDKAIESAMRQWISVKAYDELLASPVIVPASEAAKSG